MKTKLMGVLVMVASMAALAGVNAQPPSAAPKTVPTSSLPVLSDEPLAIKAKRTQWEGKKADAVAKTTEIAKQRAAIAAQNGKITAKDAEIVTEKGKLPGLIAAKAALENERDTLTKTGIPAAKAAVAKAEGTLLDETATQASLDTAFSEAKGRGDPAAAVTILKEAADKQKLKTDAADRAVAAAKADVTRLETRLTALPGLITNAQTAIDTQNGVVATLEGERNGMTAVLQGLNTGLTTLEGELVTLLGEADTLYGEFRDLYVVEVRARDTLRGVQDTGRDVKTLQAKLDAQQKQLDELAKKVDGVDTKVTRLELKVDTGNERLVTVLKDTGEIKGDLKIIKGLLEGHSTKLTAIVGKLPEGKLIDEDTAKKLVRNELMDVTYQSKLAATVAADVTAKGGNLTKLEEQLTRVERDMTAVKTKIDALPAAASGGVRIKATPYYYCGSNTVAYWEFTVEK
jgi:chromosome segregation ATPase